MRQPIMGPGRPRSLGSAGAWAQVGVDLAGDVPLEAADDLLLGQAFFAAPVDVGAGGRVGAHPGDDDPVEGVVSLPVAAGVEPISNPASSPPSTRRRLVGRGPPACSAPALS